jgi:hypothetical protein
LIFAGLTGANEWLRSLLGIRKPNDVEERIQKLEKRLDDLEKN